MKRALALLFLTAFLATGVTPAQQPSNSDQPARRGATANRPFDLERFKQALAENRRRLFASAMSSLSAEQLQTFWAVYADFEKEKNAISSARLDLAHKYAETFTSTAGLADSDIVEVVHEMAAIQHKNIDLRVKYFDIYRARIDAKTAGRFGLVDDYITTAMRLDLLDEIPFPGDAPK